MGVTDEAHSDDTLEALDDSPIANAKLMLAVCWGVVTNHDGKATLSLDLHQSLFEPGDLVAWVVPLAPDVEVKSVASVSVVGDNL